MAGEPVVQGTNDHEEKSLVTSGGSPSDSGKGFDIEGMDFAGREGGDGLPGDGFVLAECFRGGRSP